MANDPSRRRIAVIAIHGVADQKLGDTAQALAELLIAQGPNGAAYAPGQRSDILLQVPPLEPIAPVGTAAASVRKELRQSVRSDYLREGGYAHGDARTLDAKKAAVSRGVEFTSYLLAKAKANQKTAEAYTMPVISLQRHSQTTDEHVDVLEMYWADLSRLAGNVPTILTELFTFLFRMSQLARDTVQWQAAVPPFAATRSWRVLGALQMALDWMYSRVLALLFLQLIMFVLILVPFGLARNFAGPLYTAVSAILVVAATSLALYSWHRPALAVMAGGATALLLWLAQTVSVWVLGGLWLVVLGIAYEAWMRLCEERFPLVRLVGNTLAIISAAIVIAYAVAAAQTVPGGNVDLTVWIIGALNGVDRILQAIVFWWFIAGIALVLWLIAGFVAARSHPIANRDDGGDDGGDAVSPLAQARASVATGRMGLVISLGFFVLLTMTAWALLKTSVENAAANVPFASSAFPAAPSVAPAAVVVPPPGGGTPAAATPMPMLSPSSLSPSSATPQQQADPCKDKTDAQQFLCKRFVNSTETFSLIVYILGALVAYLVLMLGPSIVAEISASTLDGRKLGLWLTRGYRWMEPALGAIVALAVIAACVVGIVLVAFQFNIHAITEWTNEHLEPLRLSQSSQTLLTHVVVIAGTTTIALAAAGRLLSRYVPWLRAPLDAALDVDNHFREFPRTAIPRARIFSRFASVLEYVAASGYDRVVIVAHSQGTVIAAELLRYFKEVAATAQPDSRTLWVWSRLEHRIAIVTAGCPLRQLYAARFPVLYDWVLGMHSGVAGPAAADIGAARWVNLYATGDYVGRWLWSRPPRPSEYPPAEVDEADAAHGSAYVAPDFAKVDLNELLRGVTEKDICLGSGAHTHYFDRRQSTVARVVDAMLA